MDARSHVPTARFSDNRNNQTAENSAGYSRRMPLNQPDLRLILANRFRRMLRWHDQARDQLLASHPTKSS